MFEGAVNFWNIISFKVGKLRGVVRIGTVQMK
jgi:hypothetical protein